MNHDAAEIVYTPYAGRMPCRGINAHEKTWYRR